jgi:uncharacterized protein YjbJ (UPF0337 family)
MNRIFFPIPTERHPGRNRIRNALKKPNQDSNKMQSNRKPVGGNTMKSSTRDNAEGKMHQVKGKIKEIAGQVSMNPDLEAEGKEESTTGKVQEKIGEIKKIVGK